MHKKKISKKAVRALLDQAIREAVSRLELPAPSKRIRKIISHSAKELAAEYSHMLKKERKKAREAARPEAVEDETPSRKKTISLG